LRYHAHVLDAGTTAETTPFDRETLADCEKVVAIDPDRDTAWSRREEAYALRGDIYAEDLQQDDRAAEEYAKEEGLRPATAVQSLTPAPAVPPRGPWLRTVALYGATGR